MSDMSNYLEGKLGDHVLRNTTYTSPATVYLAIYTAVTDAEAGTGTEVSGSGTAYAREVVVCGAGTDGVYTNSSDIEFDPATGAGFGLCTHWCIRDASTAGNALTKIKTMTASKQIDVGDILRFPAGSLSFTFA